MRTLALVATPLLTACTSNEEHCTKVAHVEVHNESEWQDFLQQAGLSELQDGDLRTGGGPVVGTVPGFEFDRRFSDPNLDAEAILSVGSTGRHESYLQISAFQNDERFVVANLRDDFTVHRTAGGKSSYSCTSLYGRLYVELAASRQ